MMLLFMSSKNGSSPHEIRNLCIHIFMFQLSSAGLLYFASSKGEKVKQPENKADRAPLSETKQCLEVQCCSKCQFKLRSLIKRAFLFLMMTNQQGKWLTNNMKQNLSVSQAILFIFWKLNVHYHGHKSPPFVPTLTGIQSTSSYSIHFRSVLILFSHL